MTQLSILSKILFLRNYSQMADNSTNKWPVWELMCVLFRFSEICGPFELTISQGVCVCSLLQRGIELSAYLFQSNISRFLGSYNMRRSNFSWCLLPLPTDNNLLLIINNNSFLSDSYQWCNPILIYHLTLTIIIHCAFW